MSIYVVKQGDTVDLIAADYGIAVSQIIYDNQLIYPYGLAIGQALYISTPTEAEKYSAYVGGYAYPFISTYVLTQTLPYLSDLFIFSYGFTTEGDLIPPILDDNFMIRYAYEYDAAPILTLTPFGADGQFNNYLITSLVNDSTAKENLINQITETIVEKGFAGVDVDFEFILATDKDAFAQFVRELRVAVNELGYPVSVALAPKTSDEQAGLLYAGKDYRQLGEAADYVLLMTYEWGYTYGPPMAVAPLNKVREVVEYALTRIPPEKINLGIPNYGYDWTLPYVRGSSMATTIGNVEAAQIAIQNGVPIQYDTIALSPHFTYYSDGIEHEVWFEDVRSLQEKFNLVKEYGLRGMSYWQIMQLFRANWLLLADNFTIL